MSATMSNNNNTQQPKQQMILEDLIRLASFGLNMEAFAGAVPSQLQEKTRFENNRRETAAAAPVNRQETVQQQARPLDLSLKRLFTTSLDINNNNQNLNLNQNQSSKPNLKRNKQQAFQTDHKSLLTSSISPVSSNSSSTANELISSSELLQSQDVIISSSQQQQQQSRQERRHMKRTKSHLCQHCGRLFSRSDMLTRHSRLHSGLKPYQCGKCKQVFSRSDHLSTHERTHTGEKPYQCQFCAYSACRRDMITRHMRIHGLRGKQQEQASISSTSSNLNQSPERVTKQPGELIESPESRNSPSESQMMNAEDEDEEDPFVSSPSDFEDGGSRSSLEFGGSFQGKER